MSESLTSYNHFGPEPPTYPLPPEEIATGLFFADIFSLVNPAELCARGIYNVAAARNCEGSYPYGTECAYIDEPATLFALADVRRSGYPVLVHCDGTGEGVDFAMALLVMSDRLSAGEALERITQKFPYISLRPASWRQLRGFEEMLIEEERKKARLYDHMASTSQALRQNMRGLLLRYLRTP
ncbi:hypothetical protein B0F90DRAFT_1817529 [Multifurca ochricompacta]|uniref:Uncharacterized protein n=1 Tax=Multifurca ochricompacta TaxID=376703 RepID=A0AAD4QN70_9AGAM|nr:hypothetical protein B0F90DRAFT_1817529 [Multifurca ochricompacta]